MKLLKIILMVLLLYSVSVLSLACTPESDEADLLESQTVTVQRGNLIIDITAVGNLALSHTEDLAFEIAGTVEEVLVEEGDNVEEGQVLAKLDTSEWEDNLEVLRDQVTAAEHQLIATEQQLTAQQIDLLQAEINLGNSEIALAKANGTYEWPDPDYEAPLESAQADVDDAERLLRYIKKYEDGTPKWDTMERLAKEGVAAAERRLQTLLTETEEEVAIKELQVELAQARLDDARQAVRDAEKDVWDAQKEVEDAQEELDEAKATSIVIRAPFAGLVTEVNVSVSDAVKKGHAAIVLTDPDKFEAEILVNEMDIFQVKLGGEAWVQVDALQGMSLPARVTHISPTATIQSGVVNYKVTVEIQSPETVMHQRQETRQEGMPDISSGQLPERLRQAIEAGLITQEQAEEMLERMQEGQMTFPPGGEEMPTVIAEDFQLREGLTVTVSILVAERNDVLLVPNAAISSREMETYVQVLSPDGVIEERAIKTGISNWQFTEVIEGLSEGEKVVVPQGTTTTPTTPQRGRMPFLPGGGPH